MSLLLARPPAATPPPPSAARRPRRALAAGVVLAALAIPAAGRQLPTFSETLEVRLLEVDVAVTDRRGGPVTGLEREDFRLRLDGAITPPDYFAEVGAGSGEPLSVLLLVDSRTLRAASRERAFAELLPELGSILALPSARVRIVEHDGAVRLVEDWTRDADALREALARLAAGRSFGEAVDARERQAQVTMREMLANMRGDPRDRIVAMASIDGLLGELRSHAYQSLRETERHLLGLQTVVRSLALVPGRKLVVYLTEGWAVRPADGALQQMQSALSGTTSRDNDATSARVSQTDVSRTPTSLGEGFMSRDVTHEMLRGRQAVAGLDASQSLTRLIALANAYRVRFFPLMPAPGDAAAADARAKGRGELEVSDLREGLARLAEETGGLASLSETALSGALRRVAADAAHHYSLAVTAPSGDAAIREVQVEVGRRRAGARHPTLYLPRTVEARLVDLTLAGMATGVGANPHRLELEPLGETAAGDGDREVQLRLVFPIGGIGLVEAAGVHRASAQVAVVVLEGDGRVREAQHLQVPLQIPAGDLEQAKVSFYQAAIQLRLPAGTHRVGLGLWDAVTQTSSRVVREIEVAAETG
ncbi:MAG TPA: VWA domain-containing protein [Thermoanaerobaculia bacterium]|nr:VWA domain-containing protein [Thermoanaerobaculia bacterium]